MSVGLNANVKPSATTPNEGLVGAQRTLLHLIDRTHQCARIEELLFTMANETWRLQPYRQAYVWWNDLAERPRLRVISGLARLAEDSPMTVWLKQLRKALAPEVGRDPVLFTRDHVPDALRQGWAEWMPPHLFVLPVIKGDQTADARVMGALWLAMDDEPSEASVELLMPLLETYAFVAGVLEGKRHRQVSRWTQRLRAWRWGFLVLALLALLIPVRLTALAPAEVVALQATAVAAPMDGVVATFFVQPNQAVKTGDRLLALDDTTLRNRREVAAKQLAVAQADAMAAQQKAFDHEQSRADLAVMQGRVAERTAELAYLDEQLTRIEIRAPRDGVAVFGDVNDWQGKPVVTGERVLQLADPQDAGVLVWMPVADAINLREGARVRLFLHTQPLKPIEAELIQTSYQASTSPEGISSYRIRARFESSGGVHVDQARIGLKGTAKVYGDRAPLAYYLFRRPLAALREWTGF